MTLNITQLLNLTLYETLKEQTGLSEGGEIVKKYYTFEIPISYDYETRNKEYYKVICDVIVNEPYEEYNRIKEVIYFNNASNSLKKLYLNDKEIKEFYKKYNYNDYMVEVMRIVL